MRTIILASASLGRKEILEKIGLRFKTESSNYQEGMTARLEPHLSVKNISLAKAKAVACRHENAIVIAADTIMVFGDKIFGKPHTEKMARTMLKALSGKSHSVITGLSIVDTNNNKMLSKAVETKVYIRKLTLSEIDTYVKSKEPLDKAGAYAIQGLGAVLVEKIEGDYFNVVGLPLSSLTEALKEFGVNIL